MDEVLAVHQALRAREATLATAESLTGGGLAARVTAVSGASEVYVGGVVAYATAVKVAVLGVPEQVVSGAGVISAECAEAMAVGVRELTGATYALSTTGVAGPDRQEDHRPGTVYVGLAGPDGVRSRRLTLEGDRSRICEESIREALDWLRQVLGPEQAPLG